MVKESVASWRNLKLIHRENDTCGQYFENYATQFHNTLNFIDPKPSGVFIDIGACNGMISLPAARSKYFTKVVAIEPSRMNYEMLCRNVELNCMSDRVMTINVACYSREGTEKLWVGSMKNQGAFEIRLKTEDPRTEDVEIHRLDTLIDLSDVGMIWCDAQGSDMDVLLGSGDHSCIWNLEFAPNLLKNHGWTAKRCLAELSSRFRKFIDCRYKKGKFLPIKEIKHTIDHYFGKGAKDAAHFTDLLLVP